MATRPIPSGARPCVGAAIRELRSRRGLSARALSARAGFGTGYVCKLEAGQVEPSLRAFAQLALVLEMSPYEVWTVVANEAAFSSQLSAKVGA